VKTGRKESAAVLAEHSKSFALAGRLFPPGPREDAAAVYAWCRLSDDAIDLAPMGAKAQALLAERERLARVYSDDDPGDPILKAFQEVVRDRRIPACYPEELLEGLAMDADCRRYETLEDLLLYCYRVAGTVGLMMCHVMGVSDPRGLRHAAHLGMAMQLTNISRDVLEDWGRGHVYLPDDLLGRARRTPCGPGSGSPTCPATSSRRSAAPCSGSSPAPASSTVGRLGMRWLSWRCALSVRTARYVYSEIGAVIDAGGHDVWQGRAVVPTAASSSWWPGPSGTACARPRPGSRPPPAPRSRGSHCRTRRTWRAAELSAPLGAAATARRLRADSGEEGGDVGGGEGRAEQVALQAGAAVRLEEGALGLRLDALRHHLEAEAAAQAEDGLPRAPPPPHLRAGPRPASGRS
jgi:15-cis-phytoene synthase